MNYEGSDESLLYIVNKPYFFLIEKGCKNFKSVSVSEYLNMSSIQTDAVKE